MKTRHLALSLLVLSLASCSTESVRWKKVASPDAQQLAVVIGEYTEAAKRLDAFTAPYFNVEENLSKFGDYPSPAFFQREKQLFQSTLEKLKSVNASGLTGHDRSDYLIFKEDLETSLKELNFPNELLDFNQMGNRLHSYLDDSSEALTSFPFNSVKHYDDFVERSKGFPDYINNQIAVLKRGIQEKIVLSCVAAKSSLNTYKDGLEKDVEKNPFYRPVLFMPKDFPAADQARLKQAFHQMVAERILPGFQKFDSFFKKEYLPHCRNSYGIGSLPRGKEWYAFEILKKTNLALTPEQVHATGLSEVKRIQAELEKVQKQLNYPGTFKTFIKSLTHDDKFFFTTPEQMKAALEKVRGAIASKVPSYFSLLPKSDYKIVETSNPEDAAGSYLEPTENIPYGRFLINAKNVRSMPVYEVTTLSLHETVPGHHFQIALQFEMKEGLSEYRRKLFYSNSFVEGWALYAEYLGIEMGMFTDPMQRLGQLNDEMLRAVRLVVDSGIHAYGWSREKAMKYMEDHLATDIKDISNEANRYSVWPGQALGYKIGQLKIIELRKKAEQALGPKFDIKDFHRYVIGNGTVSLGILEQQIDEYIALTKNQ